MFLLGLLASAWAESAQPTPVGTVGIYSGLHFGQWDTFESKGEQKNAFDLATKVGWYSQYETGVYERVDIKIGLPIGYSHMGDDAPDTDRYEPTLGINYPFISSRISLFREGGKIPFSAAANVAFKTGFFHRGTINRVTNAGEGTNDFGAGLILSRFLSKNSKWVSIEGDVRYWFRQTIGTDLDSQYPYDDITYSLNVYGSFLPKVGVGAFIEGFERLGGVDYPASSDILEEQFWTSLNTAQTKAGLKASYFINGNWGVHCFGAYSISARNTPDNEWIAGSGVSYYRSAPADASN